MITSFLICLIGFTVIGALASLKVKPNTKDYLLASSSISPLLTALSAVATNNSGYMFVGMIGYTYQVGLSSIWLMVGWVMGDLLASFVIHQRLRERTQTSHALSFASVLSQWQGMSQPWVRIIGGLFTLIFLCIYAAAQLKAGSKALHILFGWDLSMGALMGTAIVIIYCFSGGIRASIWTDCAQSVVMLLAMVIVACVAIQSLGGLNATNQHLQNVSSGYMHLFTDKQSSTWLGPSLFVLGWMFAGFGVVGQPHIMVRFMALNHPNQMMKTRVYYYGFYIVFFAITILVGLCARLLLPESNQFDAELALPTIAIQLLPDVMVGLVLAGLFAATMSTADSQIISCTAAITIDLCHKTKFGYRSMKCVTLLIALAVLGIALFAHDSVFQLVLIAWASLACTFTPLMCLLATNQQISQCVAVASMLTGFTVMLLWRYLGLSPLAYEVLPGILAGFIPYGLARLKKHMAF